MAGIRLLLTPLALLVAGAAAVAAEPASLAEQAREVLANHCYRCHGQNGSSKGG
jgi:mono/diheme cytochrome c family protein